MNIEAILESLLFVNEKPIETRELVNLLGLNKKEIEGKLENLSSQYKERGSGICIVKIAGGYQMCSAPFNEEWIRKMYREKNKSRLSSASLETLAIVAYKQPITRPEMEAVRGVNVDGVTRHILELGLIKEAGRKDVPGRPFFYITTRKFLEYFGLNFLEDLPKLEEFSEFGKGMEESGLANNSADNSRETSSGNIG
ncbi:MAG: SMC-Scp complex subunit ScpB [Candidatus Omnitrophica bacterium]|nr:SMC-Scp complex subunit ScpB [Candidatus Omnitrophota bacterium]